MAALLGLALVGWALSMVAMRQHAASLRDELAGRSVTGASAAAEAEELRNLLLDTPDLAFVTTPTGIVHFVSRAAQTRLGARAAKGANLLDLVPAEHRPEVQRVLEAAAGGGRAEFSGTFEGREGAFAVHMVASHATWGGAPASLALCRDVSDRVSLERALDSDHAFLHQVLTASPHAVFVYRVGDGLCLLANEAGAQFLADVASGGAWHLREAEVWAQSGIRDLVDQALAEKARKALEVRFERKSGGSRWVACTAVPFTVQAADQHVLLLLEDCTDRRIAEEEVRTTRTMIQTVLDAMPQYICWRDDQGLILGCNQSYAQAAGATSPYDLLGTCANPFVLVDSAEPSGTQYHALERARTREGREVWLDITRIPLLSSRGPPMQLWAIEDVTEERETEARSRERDQQLRTLLDSLPATAYFKDVGLHYVAANQTWCRGLGLALDELVGKTDRDLFPPEVAQELERDDHRVIAFDVPVSGEEEQVAQDGRRVVAMRKLPVHDDEGRVVGLVGLGFDVTDRKRAEEELRAAKEQAEAGTKAKSAFLANMSHEIRTPMNGVLGTADLLLATPLSPEQRHLASTLQRSGEALLVILNDILDFSKIESGKLQLESVPFNLEDVIYDVVELHRSRTAAGKVDLLVQVNPAVPAVYLGDPGRLRQILGNLLGNALKFTTEGRVLVRAAHRLRSDHTVELTLSVSDTGPGIPPDRAKQLFQPFVQADSSTARRYGGTGLGLAISRALAEAMQGSLSLQTEVGVGSTFTARIVVRESEVPVPVVYRGSGQPVLVAETCGHRAAVLRTHLEDLGFGVLQASTAEEVLRQAGKARVVLAVPELWAACQQLSGAPALLGLRPSSGAPGDLPGAMAVLQRPSRPSQLAAALGRVFRAAPEAPVAAPAVSNAPLPVSVLVAEDNPVNQMIARKMLESMGASVVLAGNGREAVKAWSEGKFDLVLMDCQMPEMDGYEATAAIRARETEGGRLPIIALTASALPEDRARSLAAGMDDHIPKPISLGSLRAAVERWAAKRGDRG